MSVNETSGMTEYERRMVALEEGRALRNRMLVSYLLWFFLGWLMLHRLYINGNFKSVVFWFMVQVVAWTIFFVAAATTPILFVVSGVLGAAWVIRYIVDLFTIPRMLRTSIAEATLRQMAAPSLEKDAPTINLKSKGEDYVVKG